MAIIDNVKEVARLAQEIGKIELYKQAVELMAQVTDLATENFELKQQVTDLNKKLEVHGSITYDRPSHSYRVNGIGAYCVTCYDQFGALQRLHAKSAVVDQERPDSVQVQWQCQRCKWNAGNWHRITIKAYEWADEPTTNSSQTT